MEYIEEVTDAVVIAEDLNIEEAMSRRDYIMKELRSWCMFVVLKEVICDFVRTIVIVFEGMWLFMHKILL